MNTPYRCIVRMKMNGQYEYTVLYGTLVVGDGNTADEAMAKHRAQKVVEAHARMKAFGSKSIDLYV